MKLAVVGAGAMGGALAAEAALAGHEVTIVDVSEPLVGQVNAHGIEVHGGGAVVTGRPRATTDAATVGPVDVVVLFVKAQHTRSAAATIAQLRDADTVVLSLQNGWGNAPVLAEVLGTGRLTIGVTYHSCSVLGLGVVNHTGRGATYVGDYDGDGGAARVATELLDSAGWTATVTSDVRTEIWKKLVLNAATLPTSALSGLNAGSLGANAPLTPLVAALAREASAVAVAQGLAIDPEERVTYIANLLANAGSGKSSMLQDAEARRKTEVEVINGAVSAAGRAHGVPTPLNDAMSALVGGLESSWA